MIVAALALALQTGAQPPASPASQSPPVVIVAPREFPTRKSSIEQVVTNAQEGQIARFEAPLCPAIAGIDPRLATTMIAIIRSNAKAAGARVGGETCRPNAVLLFASDPPAFMASLVKRAPLVIRAIPKRRRTGIVKGHAAVRSWHSIRPTGAYSMPVVEEQVGPPTNYIHSASRLGRSIRLDMASAVTIIDAARIEGTTVQQLADLATMHLLLDISPEAAGVPDDSILHLMSHDDAPKTLTTLDRGMLAGLYRAPRNNVSAWQQRARMNAAAAEPDAQ